jgi:hypothetical protein
VAPADVRSAFAAPEAWFPPPKPKAIPAPPPPVAKQQFQGRYELTGVMLTPEGAKAIINGRCLTPGQKLDGFTLVSVTPAGAILTGEAATLLLRLRTSKKPSGAGER